MYYTVLVDPSKKLTETGGAIAQPRCKCGAQLKDRRDKILKFLCLSG